MGPNTKSICRAEYPQDTELHRIVAALQAIQARHFYKLRAVLTRGANSNHYCHENTVHIELYDTRHEYAMVNEYEGFKQLCRDLMRKLYKQLEAAYNYENSDDAMIEACEANDYQFTITGDLI